MKKTVRLSDEILDPFDEWDERDEEARLRKLREAEEEEESIFDLPYFGDDEEEPTVKPKRGRLKRA